MRAIDRLLQEYGESHQNHTNKTIHWICVPAIMFSLLGLIYAVPFFFDRSFFANWAFVFLLGALIYYFVLSFPMFIGFILIGGAMLIGIQSIYAATNYDAAMLAIISAVIFILAWIGQFIGHNIEGKKPSFLKDVQFLLIGPAWLMHFIFKRFGISF
jgi:uncharacterized membrane protein YGL010W